MDVFTEKEGAPTLHGTTFHCTALHGTILHCMTKRVIAAAACCSVIQQLLSDIPAATVSASHTIVCLQFIPTSPLTALAKSRVVSYPTVATNSSLSQIRGTDLSLSAAAHRYAPLSITRAVRAGAVPFYRGSILRRLLTMPAHASTTSVHPIYSTLYRQPRLMKV